MIHRVVLTQSKQPVILILHYWQIVPSKKYPNSQARHTEFELQEEHAPRQGLQFIPAK